MLQLKDARLLFTFITEDEHAIQKLWPENAQAKRILSSTHQARVEIEAPFHGADLPETPTHASSEGDRQLLCQHSPGHYF